MDKKIEIGIGALVVVVVIAVGIFVSMRVRNQMKMEAQQAAMGQQRASEDEQKAQEADLAKQEELARQRRSVLQDVVQVEDASTTKASVVTGKFGIYEPYEPEKLQNATTGNVVLFFNASDSLECQVLDADIRANIDNIPKNLTILDVDYDTALVLKQRYNAFNEHTFVQVDELGTPLKMWAGSATLDELVIEVI